MKEMRVKVMRISSSVNPVYDHLTGYKGQFVRERGY